MSIPQEIISIIKKIQAKGYKAYIVGGCVRDILLGLKPKDWDITTNAKPKEIQAIFAKSFYQNKFGTVIVTTKSKDPTIQNIEITTFRIEGKYSDKRHPDKIKFGNSLKQDLARRDFTINAMAALISFTAKKTFDYKIIDPFQGQKDLKNKIIRAVGEPKARFNEDALRLMRAVRLATELNFTIEPKTFEAIIKNAGLLQAIAKERIQDEFKKIIMSQKPQQGIELLRKCHLLQYIIPELEKGVGVSQNKSHIYDVYEHSIRSLQAAAQQKFNLTVRLAALLHDIAKPETKQGEGPDAHFYNHDYIGAKISIRILERLKFPKKIINKVAILIRNHMFVSDPDKLTESGARRLIRRVGLENIPDLINLRIADRLGMGRPKARPYRLREIEYLLEKVSHDPISVKMLKINGNDIIRELKIKPGPKIGAILEALLAEVINDPQKNNKKYLIKRIKELNKENLEELRKKARRKIEEKKEEEDLKIKEKYWIK